MNTNELLAQTTNDSLPFVIAPCLYLTLLSYQVPSRPS